MTEAGPRRCAWLRWLPLAVLLALSLGIAAAGGAQLLDLDRISEARASLQAAVAEDPVRAIALTVLVFVCGVVVSIPAVTVALTALSGLLFGTLTGALISVGSATTGAMIVFSIGRLAAGDLIRRRAGARLGRFAEGFRRDGFGYVLTLRLLPIFPFWMTNLAPAAFGVSFRSFFLATLLGLIPGAFIFSGLGSGLDEVLTARTPPGMPASPRAAAIARSASTCAPWSARPSSPRSRAWRASPCCRFICADGLSGGRSAHKTCAQASGAHPLASESLARGPARTRRSHRTITTTGNS